jgi:hypothetical protein
VPSLRHQATVRPGRRTPRPSRLQAFLSWAQDTQSSGCDSTATITSDYHAGERHSKAAGKAKSAFVDLWNPIAATYSLDSRSDNDI